MRFLDRGAWASNPIIPVGQGVEFFTYEQLQRMTIESLKAWLRRRIGGYTVAIKYTTTMNRFYRGRAVRYVRVEVADQEKLHYSFFTLGYSDKFSRKAILWNDDLGPEIERRANVAFEHGQWISRDGFGRIYDIH
jgi:hypothetical protein